ncbi:uncharacterized protein [Lepeophtheirus salmonis]|uniref:uncharacterized protein n=1 Tax=Lepeophtheirus salmonis TaxID=72036 RepID=UPI001AEA5104|nr:uncharacterized mitochondrial protein AtMg00860-like [Lepeophtheirus salmonis]
MGLNASGDEYCRRGDSAMSGIKNMHKIVETWEENVMRLNPNKIKIGEEVKFTGLIIGKNGVKVDPCKIEGIIKFSEPKNISQLQRIQLWGLISSKNVFQWLPDHSKVFEEVKNRVCTSPILTHYDPKKQVTLMTDASRLHGLGYTLMRGEEGFQQLVLCGSRFISESESRYATH